MPKQIYKLDQFHGGLNSNADPRDIFENELSSATDIMVDELGTIRTLGSAVAHPSETGAGSISHAAKITPGYGLFAWKADRKLAHVAIADYHGTHTGGDSSTTMTDSSATFPVNALVGATIKNTTDGSSGVITANTLTTVTVGSLTGGSDNSWDNADNDAYKITDIPTTGESYLSLSDADATGTVKIYAMGSDTWGAPIANRNDISGGTRKDVFYAANGSLRVCDAVFENNNTSKFHGYADKIFLSSLSGDEVIYDYWTTQSQYIATPSANSSFDQAIATTGLTPSSIETRTSGEVDAADTNAGVTSSGGSQGYFESDAVWAAASVANIYKLTVEVQINSTGTSDATYAFTITGGEASNSTTFRGSLGTNHKSSNRSGVAKIDGVETTIDTVVFTFLDPETNTPLTSSGTTHGVRVLIDDVIMGADIESISIHTVQVQESTGVVTTTHKGVDGTAIGNGEIFGEYAFSSPAEGIAIGWDKKWEHGFTFIYDDIQESLVRRVKDITATSTDTDGSTLDYSYEQSVTDSSHCPDTRISIKYDDTWSPRITGAIWYIRDVSGDIPSKWWGQVEYNFVKATCTVLASGKEFTAVKNVGNGEIMFDVDQEYLLQPNQTDTYLSRNGFSEDNESITARFKSAVQVGRRIYIGNVQIIKEDGTTETKGDGMLKSPPNRFDTFPSSNLIEASINDGESIIALAEFADRILQYKEDTLYIINVSQDIEFLEDTHKYKGVSQPSSVCKTDYGIAWVNKFGCYLYDGKQVSNLLEKGGRQIIKDHGSSSWETFSANSPMIGYLPHKRQLLLVDDNTTTGTGNIMLYDMVTQSWIEGSDATITSQALTNFVNDSNGNLVWSHTSDTATMRMWNDDSSAKSGLIMTTKDIDFGQPGIRKKLYKVLITYDTGNATSNVQVDYDVNGGTTFPYDFANGTNFSSTELASANGWQVAELKPDVSSEANNIKSFRLRFATDGTVPAGFKINDISCIYRAKPIK